MKRWAIVDLQTLEIKAEYRFMTSQLGSGAFGGPNNDPSQVMHLPVASGLDNASMGELQCILEDPGQLLDDCGCPMSQRTPQGDPVAAFDSEGAPIMGPDGTPLKVQRFISNPVLGRTYKIVRK